MSSYDSDGYWTIAKGWEITEDPLIVDLLSQEDEMTYIITGASSILNTDDEGAPNLDFHSKS